MNNYTEELQPPTVSQNPLDFGILLQGGSNTLQEFISNPSNQPLLWRADTGRTSWLTLDKSAGTLQPGQQQIVNVTVDTRSLAIGGYDATLTFTSEGDDISASMQVLITLIISPVLPPTVGLSFGTLFLNSSKTLPLLISNRDSRPVDWKVDTGGTSWLTLNRSAGTLQPHEQQTIYVTANTRSLAFGGYTATLILTSDVQGTSSAGVQIPVELHVGVKPFGDDGPHFPVVDVPGHRDDYPRSPLYTPALSFGTLQQDRSKSLPLEISNPKENGQVDWILNTGEVSWLTLDRSAGTLQPGQQQIVNVTVDPRSLTAETYRTDLILSFTFDPNKEGREPATVLIPVMLAVP